MGGGRCLRWTVTVQKRGRPVGLALVQHLPEVVSVLCARLRVLGVVTIRLALSLEAPAA